MSNSIAGWCNQCGSGLPIHFADCPTREDEKKAFAASIGIAWPLASQSDDSVLSIRLCNAQQVAADLAARLNDLHREACVDERLAAMVILPLIGDANRIENVLAQLVEVRK